MLTASVVAFLMGVGIGLNIVTVILFAGLVKITDARKGILFLITMVIPYMFTAVMAMVVMAEAPDKKIY